MRFDLTDLRLFVHVAEAASITHGASRSNLALASASARLRGMEEILGTALLERGRRGIRLTPAGRALLHHARVVLQQLERMRGELGEYATGVKGQVRLLSNTAALTEFLPDTLASYLARHPRIDIELEERPSHEIVRALAEGLADAGIVADTVELGGLETFPFRVDQLVLVAPRRDVLARRRHVSFAEILGRDFVGLGPRSALQDYLGQHAARAGQRLRLRVQLNSFDAICRMVEQGVGVAIVPATAARRCQRSMRIRGIRLADRWAFRRLTICVRRLDELPAHARSLIEHLRAAPESG